MLSIFRRIMDLVVVVLLVIGFGLIFQNNFDPSYWDEEEWLVFGAMIWTTIRLGSELVMDLMKKIMEEAKKEIMKDLVVNK